MNEYGARVERGKILKITEQKYVVASLSRSGITTPPIPAMDAQAEYAAGDTVYFILFEDGHGCVLAKAE